MTHATIIATFQPTVSFQSHLSSRRKNMLTRSLQYTTLALSLALTAGAGATTPISPGHTPPVQEWAKQLGSPKINDSIEGNMIYVSDIDDYSTGFSSDSQGNLYAASTKILRQFRKTVSGLVTLVPAPYTSPIETTIAKYDTQGNVLWSKTKTLSNNTRTTLSTDPQGNTYALESTSFRNLPFYYSNSSGGPFIKEPITPTITKYDTQGNILWTRQAPVVHTLGQRTTVTTDNLGNLYFTAIVFNVAPQSTTPNPISVNASAPTLKMLAANLPLIICNKFITKYDADGTIAWIKKFGTQQTGFINASQTANNSISTDNLGNLYIAGFTQGGVTDINQGQAGSFLAKYDANGNILWSKKLNRNNNDNIQYVQRYVTHRPNGLDTDAQGNIYLTETVSRTPEGTPIFYTDTFYTDTFFSKYSTQGDLLWTKALDPNTHQNSNTITVDKNGNAYLAGYTDAPGMGRNPFIAKYDTDGQLLWTKELDTSQVDDYANGIAIDDLGNIYLAGETRGSTAGPHEDGLDIFIIKFKDLQAIPEPTSLLLLSLPLLALNRRKKQ